jgi:hypothetical protein
MYTWKIAKVECLNNDNPDLITQVSWILEAKQNNTVAYKTGMCGFVLNNTKPLIAFSDITDEIIIEWIIQLLGDDLIQYHQNQLAQELRNQNDNSST